MDIEEFTNNLGVATLDLNSDNKFIHYDIPLSEIEVSTLKSCKIIDVGDYNSNNYKDITLNSFIKSKLSECDRDVVANLINNIIYVADSVDRANEYTSYEVRVLPAGKIDKWHVDTLFRELPYRNIITLISAEQESTIFYNGEIASIRNFDSANSKFQKVNDDFDPSKISINDDFDPSKISIAEFGQGTVFLQGIKEGAIHKAPHASSPRLVLLIDKNNEEFINRTTLRVKCIETINQEAMKLYNLAREYPDNPLLMEEIMKELNILMNKAPNC